jgi:hypothetical protein
LEGRCKTSPASSSQAGGSRWICPSGKHPSPSLSLPQLGLSLSDIHPSPTLTSQMAP